MGGRGWPRGGPRVAACCSVGLHRASDKRVQRAQRASYNENSDAIHESAFKSKTRKWPLLAMNILGVVKTPKCIYTDKSAEFCTSL